MKTPVILLLASLVLTACGAESEPKTEKSTESSASPNSLDAADVPAPVMAHDLADVVATYGLTPAQDEGYYWATLPDGTRCEIENVLYDRAMVQTYVSAGDPVAINADMTIGFVVTGENEGTCQVGLSKMLGYQP